MAAAARRAAAAAVRHVVAAPPCAVAIHRAGTAAAIHRAGTPAAIHSAAAIHRAGRRVAAIHRAGRRVAAIHRASSSAATPPSSVAIHHASSSAATPPSPVAIQRASSSLAIHHASSSVAAGSGATHPSHASSSIAAHASSSIAAHAPSSFSATGNLATARGGLFGGRSLFIKVAQHPFKKVQRRFYHTQRSKKGALPEEIARELKRIEAEDIIRHKEMQKLIINLTKDVAAVSITAKKNQIDFTWLVGKTSWKICSAALATATLSGYALLQFIKFGWGRVSQDNARVMLEAKVSVLKKELEKTVNELFEEKGKEEANSHACKEVDLNDKALLLDKKEAELKKRETAIAAKEAAAKEPPKG